MDVTFNGTSLQLEPVRIKEVYIVKVSKVRL